MQKKTKINKFVKKPVYPGGLKAMREFIRSVMKYPAQALEAKIEGSVYIKYEVGHKGNVIKTRALSSLGYGCDEEAKRIVSLLKFEVAKNPRKMRIKFNKNIRIHFKLPRVKTVTPKAPLKKKVVVKQTFAYNITPSQPKSTNEQPVKKSGYSYTININHH